MISPIYLFFLIFFHIIKNVYSQGTTNESLQNLRLLQWEFYSFETWQQNRLVNVCPVNGRSLAEISMGATLDKKNSSLTNGKIYHSFKTQNTSTTLSCPKRVVTKDKLPPTLSYRPFYLSALTSAVGDSACDFYGLYNSKCDPPGVLVDSLPKYCSSYLYMGFFVNNGVLFDTGKQYGYLDQLLSSSTGVYVYYFHGSQMQWCTAVAANTAGKTAEMNNLKTLLDAHPGVKGLILSATLNLDAEVTSTDCPNYSQNLKSYIEFMKKTFTNLEVGITLSAKRAREWYNNSNLAWLDYKVLDTLIDFYVVNFYDLNQCSDEFTKTGVYPLSGTSNNTLDKMKTFLDNAGVCSTKVHYLFKCYADYKEISRSCDISPTNYCKNISAAKTSMCMDTLQTLYDKGAFAKINGAGFVAAAIDLDDFDCSCQCGQSFPAFNALFNGYMGNPPPQPCALFDRT